MTAESTLRVLLCAYGTLGEIHPFIALASTLRSRGHEVRLLAPRMYERNVRAAGLDFVPVGSLEGFERVLSQRYLWHPNFGYPVLARSIAEMIEPTYQAVLQNLAVRRTVLVHSWMAVGARIARDKLNVPALTLHPYPAIFRSRHDPPQLPPLPLRKGAPAWNDFWFRVADAVMDFALARPLNAHRRKLGLPPVARIMDGWVHSPDGAIGLYPEWFAPPQQDWPKQAVLTGFPLYDAGEEQLSAPLLRFLEAGPPPIVFTSGSAIRRAHAFFRTCVEICRRSGRRGVLLSPYASHLPADLPPFMHSEPYAPFSRLLPHCAALVHHGGIGTIAQALAAGIPQVAVPVVFDHADNSMRMERLGVGVSIPPGRFNARTGAAAIEQVLSDAYANACSRAKALLEENDAMALAAECIERAAWRSAGKNQRVDA